MKQCIKFLTLIYFTTTMALLPREYDPNQFLKPLEMTGDSLKYFAWCYNNPQYTKNFLPTCLLPVIDLLEYTKGQADPHAFACTVLGMFHQRMKDCQWENPYAFAQLLDRLPDLLSPITCPQNIEIQGIQEIIAKKYDAEKNILETDPELFIRSLSQDLYDYMQSHKNLSDVQHMTVRFLEGLCDKLIWDTKDEIYVWQCFKVIGTQLETLYERGIIPDTDSLNHLLWSLVYRFCYFIDLSGSGLSVETYSEMKKDLDEQNLSFLKHEEREQFMLPKNDTLARSLRFGEAKARLYPRGVLTDSVI